MTQPRTDGRGSSRGAAELSERNLNLAIARYAVFVRSAVVAVCALLGIFAAPADHRALTAVFVAVAVAWSAASAVLARREVPVFVVAALGAVALLVIGFGQLVIGPQPVDSWVFVTVSITASMSQFEWGTRPGIGVFLALLGVGGYVAGTAFAASGQVGDMLGPVSRILVETTLARIGYVVVRSKARTAGRIIERAAARRLDASVAAARRASEREYLATLHDTASATLLMVSVGAHQDRPAWLPERAERDLEALATVPSAGASRIDLAALLGTVGDHRAVRVETDLGDELVLPAAPAIGILHGVREAVGNVERHAGVGTATLRAERDGGGRIVVELRDRGSGFDPDGVSPHRRGISVSIVERMANTGGRATVRSAPGAGTAVRWVWPDD
ncbi:sensor histidine kinase [Amycolatopsis sp. NPDC059021]|uniref:sensor histidine kinase n=1 Tax=Amycolatopsis sp. NPDC059021 TaxID=3346704 RepID=UPI003671C41C